MNDAKTVGQAELDKHLQTAETALATYNAQITEETGEKSSYKKDLEVIQQRLDNWR